MNVKLLIIVKYPVLDIIKDEYHKVRKSKLAYE